MSRSLTVAARKRYAPHSLCVLWGSVGSRTEAERFVEAVAGRWERSALDLEEQLHARTPALSWSERPVEPALDREEPLHPQAPALSARTPLDRPLRRGPRIRRAAERETPENVLEEERVDSEAEVTASSSDRPHLEKSETSRQARSAQALTPRSGRAPRSGTAARGRGERPTGSAGRRPRRVVAGESQGAFVAPPGDPEIESIAREPGRSGPTADGGGVPGAITGSSEPPTLEASRRQRDRVENVSHPEVGGAASARDAWAGPGADVDPRMWTPAVSGRRARPWDPVDDGKAAGPDVGGAASARGASAGRGDDINAPVWTRAASRHRARSWDPVEDIDESARRRFEEWTLERRWREEALEEWRRWEF